MSYFPGGRLIIALCVLVLLFVAASCAPPIQHIHAGGRYGSGLYGGVLYIDDDQAASYDAQRPGDGAWLEAHEIAHLYTTGLVDFSSFLPDDGTLRREEEQAQAVAVVLTGHASPWDEPATGYWDPPADIVEATREAMVAAGVWP